MAQTATCSLRSLWKVPRIAVYPARQSRLCTLKSRLAGTLFCGGVNDAREIEGNPKLQEAYELGRSIG